MPLVYKFLLMVYGNLVIPLKYYELIVKYFYIKKAIILKATLIRMSKLYFLLCNLNKNSYVAYCSITIKKDRTDFPWINLL